jgi:hypothetical protein
MTWIFWNLAEIEVSTTIARDLRRQLDPSGQSFPMDTGLTVTYAGLPKVVSAVLRLGYSYGVQRRRRYTSERESKPW